MALDASVYGELCRAVLNGTAYATMDGHATYGSHQDVARGCNVRAVQPFLVVRATDKALTTQPR